MRKIYEECDRAELVTAVKHGEPVAAAARRFGVTPATAYTWIRKANDASRVVAQPTFIELVASGSASAGLVVRVGCAEIDVEPGF